MVAILRFEVMVGFDLVTKDDELEKVRVIHNFKLVGRVGVSA